MPLIHRSGLTSDQVSVGNDWHKTNASPECGPGEYAAIPDFERWKWDSSITGTIRSRDQLLIKIDDFVEAIGQAEDQGSKTYRTVWLYFILNSRLKEGPQSFTKIEDNLQPALMKLFRAVMRELCLFFKCDANLLPRELEHSFGRQLTFRGYRLDQACEYALYLDGPEVEKYKLYFQHGRVYQLPWWRKPTEERSGMVLADSKRAANPAIFKEGKVASANRRHWCGFSMDMGCNIYVARHFKCEIGLHTCFYHSAYTKGRPSMCAGTILMKRGRIKAIGIDSGHFRPTALHVISLLHHLETHGIDISRIQIQNYDGSVISTARDYIQSNGNLGAMIMRRQANFVHIARAHQEKRAFENIIKTLWEEALSSGTCTNDPVGQFHFAQAILREYTTEDKRPYRHVTDDYVFRVIEKSTGMGMDDTESWIFEAWVNYITHYGFADTAETRRRFAEYVVAEDPEWNEGLVLIMLARAYTAGNLPTDVQTTSTRRRKTVPPVPGSSVRRAESPSPRVSIAPLGSRPPSPPRSPSVGRRSPLLLPVSYEAD